MLKKSSLPIAMVFCLAFSAAHAADYPALLKSADQAVKVKAAQEAGNKKAVEAVPGLILLLKDKSQQVVIHAVVALGQIRDKRAIDPLIALVEKSDSLSVKAMAVQSLAHFPEARVVALLNKTVDDASPMVRSAACRSLGIAGGGKEVDKLIEKSEKDPDGLVRKTAVDALGEMAEIKNVDNKRQAIETALAKAASDPDERTRKSAEKALKRAKKEK